VSPHRVPASLRVLHVDAGREWRGGERQLLLLAQGLRDRGAEPFVAARRDSPLLHRCKAAGFATAAVQMRSDLDLLAIRRLRRLITTWRPHLVHAHDARSHALALSALVGRRRGIPLVVTRRAAVRPRGVVRHGPRIARFIAISEAVRRALISGGIAAERIQLVYPGVAAQAPPHARDWRAECGWPEGAVVAGLVGAITRARESAEFSRLVRSLATAHASGLALVVLGGPSAGRAGESGVPLFRAGFVHDVPHALAGLDLLLHPGGGDGLGTAVIEGMALGVPTVAFATGGMEEVIEQERNGLLVAPGDHAGFAAAVARLVRDEPLRRALGAAGPARARRFDPGHMVDAVLGVYRDLIERSAV
jgi:glycosyltransferase involved in cell wall biosynthesis